MKKNTETLPEFVLKDLRESEKYDNFSREVKGGYTKSNDEIEEEINQMSPDEIIKNWLEWNGMMDYQEKLMQLIESAFQVKLERKTGKTWCCWILSEEEILKAMKDYGIPHPDIPDRSGGNKEDFIEEIASEFKDALSIMGEEWEKSLRGCVENVVKTWKDREACDKEGFRQ
jgi:hypothetical protein